ncbi:hypothetical protein [Streptomyces sp. NRRL B-3648]|uniref:hypothetical protein n=1 Tax=Streptomyces sp. NRRL B-3648 TaxID=1519493 RepID=UPI000AB7FAB6|nr:hypothetical protein [Streptomyces sp. NRRL B-3648]
MTLARPPFSVRTGHNEPFDYAPYDGVPRHLVGALQAWVAQHFSPGDDYAVEACLRLRMAPLPGLSPYDALVGADGMDLLDIVDLILGWEQPDDGEPIGLGGDFEGRLARILNAAGSAYRVNDAGNGLEERVVPIVRDAVSQTIDDASTATDKGSAADHLALSWQAAYGLRPDPVRAYSEAIKAVESAAHAVVEPNNSKATLGTMLRVLRDASHRFTTSLGTGSTMPVEVMMRALWEGQTSRHGGQGGTVPETLEAARAGVHAAATLVQWFTSGAVTRVL